MTATRHDVLDRIFDAVAVGDHDAFGRLYDATVGRVGASISRHLPDAAPDALIERVYVELWRTAPIRRTSDGDATTWVSVTLETVIAGHRAGRAAVAGSLSR